MKHAHANIVKAKAENTELCLLIKRTSEQWIESQVMFPINDLAVSYYLCHPNNLEVCLAWLNGNNIVCDGAEVRGSDGNPAWFSNTIFMDENCKLKVKKEHWVIYDTINNKLFDSTIYSTKPMETQGFVSIQLELP